MIYVCHPKDLRFRPEVFSAPTSHSSPPDRRINDFETLGIKEEAVPLIMKDNAVRVLGL